MGENDSSNQLKDSKNVFLNHGKPINGFFGTYNLQWDQAVKENDLGDFTFH